MKPRLNAAPEDESAEIRDFYASSQLEPYRGQAKPVIREVLDKHGLTLRFDDIILHIENQQLTE